MYIYMYLYNYKIMGRPSELKLRVPKTLNFEYEEFKEFEAIVGKDNVSKELRAMMKNFIEKEKKGEALLDPLNQVRFRSENSSNTIQLTLDICLSTKDDIRNFIDRANDIKILAKVEENSKAINRLAHNKKMELSAMQRLKEGMV